METIAASESIREKNNIVPFLTFFLVLLMGCDLVSFVTGFSWMENLQKIALDQSFSMENALQEQADQYRLISLAQTFSLLVVLFIFSVWIYGAYENLSALNARNLNYTPGKAAFGLFIPIIQLYRPYQVVVEIWKKSEPTQTVCSHNLLKLWWGILLLTILSGYLATIISTTGLSVNRVIISSHLLHWSDLSSSFSAFLTILMIRKVEQKQNQKYLSLS